VAFKEDAVLQENIIVHAVKSRAKPQEVIVSSSSGEANGPVTERRVAYLDVVSPNDPDQFMHLVVDDRQARVRSAMSRLTTTLADLGLSVSTGRVVDFRARPFLRQQPGNDTVPLIYACHFNGGMVSWPKEKSRKPNAIVSDARTRELLVPAGIYVLVKRFSTKEERRRIVACVYDLDQIRAPLVGFENHLNYFHIRGQGLPMNLAKGLATFLNSTLVDVYFRQFNGHTQVNATDLRSLRFPTMEQLEQLGRMAGKSMNSQATLDQVVEEKIL
jgi:adenine-specific DNA-methyltransferase